MRRLAKEVKVCEITDGKPGPPLALRPEPLLRYTNVTLEVVDGTLWAWGERGRPPAVMKLGLREPMRWSAALDISRQCAVSEADRSRVPRWPDLVVAKARAGVAAAAQCAGAGRLGGPSPHSGQGHRPTALRQPGSPQPERPESSSGCCPDRSIGIATQRSVSWTDCFSVSSTRTTRAFSWSSRPGPRARSVRAWRYAVVRQGGGEMTTLLDGKPLSSVSSVPPSVDSELFIIDRLPASPEEQD